MTPCGTGTLSRLAVRGDSRDWYQGTPSGVPQVPHNLHALRRPYWISDFFRNLLGTPGRPRVALFGALLLSLAITPALAAPLPSVVLNADQIGPRAPIEELTGRNIARDYARAWQGLAEALEQNREAPLEGNVVGFAHDIFARRIAEQKKSGLHVRIVDHGHKLVAGFYAPNGDAMQLHDTAQLEIQTFDGDKMIQQETIPAHYLVLMTPAADRWVVRLLEQVPGSSAEATPEGQ